MSLTVAQQIAAQPQVPKRHQHLDKVVDTYELARSVVLGKVNGCELLSVPESEDAAIGSLADQFYDLHLPIRPVAQSWTWIDTVWPHVGGGSSPTGILIGYVEEHDGLGNFVTITYSLARSDEVVVAGYVALAYNHQWTERNVDQFFCCPKEQGFHTGHLIGAPNFSEQKGWEENCSHGLYALHVIAAMNVPRVVSVTPIRHSDKLQSARRKRGKIPLISYKQIATKLPKTVQTAGPSAIRLGLAGKRFHSVLGHLRRIETKDGPTVTWVSPHWRGDPALGTVAKTRRIETSQ